MFPLPTPLPDAEGNIPWNDLDTVPGQDIFAWITQGPIARRDRERLGRSDEGIIMLRNLLKDQLKKMQNGEPMMNVFFDKEKADNIMVRTERDTTNRIPSGPTWKYSPITNEVRAIWEKARSEEHTSELQSH